MTGEERQGLMDFILEQQAQLTANVGGFSETVDRSSVTVGHLSNTVHDLSNTVDNLSNTVDRLSEKIDRSADGISSLLAIAEIHEREITATNEKLNALIITVERIISEGRNGKS